MKNIVSKLALAAVLAVGVAAPALADVDAVASINKNKNVSVIETISINKDVNLDLDVDVDLARAAEAMALANITTSGNTVDRLPEADGTVLGGNPHEFLIRTAAIDGEGGSIIGNTGVTGVNQDVGAMTNQGNIWSIALSQENAEDPSLFADAQAEVDQKSLANNVSFISGEGAEASGQILFTTDIGDSINDNVGLTAVNQNAGNMNNQTNAVAIAAGVELEGDETSVSGASVALAEAALGQVAAANFVTETESDGTDKLSSISGSITGNAGITQVNQATSNMGNQGNVVAAGAAVLGL